MNRTHGTLVVLGLTGALWGGARAVQAVEQWRLPALAGQPDAEERLAWARYEQVLQCEVLDPCLAALDDGEGARSRACGAAYTRLAALPVPEELSPAAQANAAFVRAWWLDELGSWDTGGKDGGWAGFGNAELDTCTEDSLSARLDQHFGLVPAGGRPATCADTRRVLDPAP